MAVMTNLHKIHMHYNVSMQLYNEHVGYAFYEELSM